MTANGKMLHERHPQLALTGRTMLREGIFPILMMMRVSRSVSGTRLMILQCYL